MKNRKLFRLHWSASLALMVTGVIHAQNLPRPLRIPAIHAGQQTGSNLRPKAVTPGPQHTPAQTLKTPFERIIAPHLNQFMKPGPQSGANGGPAKRATAMPRSSRAADGVDGSSINFPGFVSAPFVTLNDGDSAEAVNAVSGDFNHDGRMDVATIREDGTIDVLLNPGSFTGIASMSPVVSNNNGDPDSLVIAWVIVADMNGDGFADLVGQDVENGQIVVWIGKGDGTFAAPKLSPVTLPAGSSWMPGLNYGSSILVGDFNNDGTMDVAAVTLGANYVATGSTTTVTEQTFLNDGQGTLIPLADENTTFKDYYFTDVYANASVTTTDGVRASGIAFLIQDAGINDSTKSGISVATLKSNGDGTFAPAIEPVKPLVQDYLITVYGSFVSSNLSSIVKSASPNSPVGTPGSGTATADIVFMTGDGAVYDAPFSSGNPTAANLLVGLDTQLFAFGGAFIPPVTTAPTPPSLISTPLSYQSTLNIADMNGDGLADLVVYGQDASYVFTNAGKGVFTDAPAQVAGANPGFQEPQPANYDGGNYNSLFDVDFALGQVGYFQNLGAAASAQGGQFQAAPLITGTNTGGNFETYGGNLEVVATPDINGDGQPDLIGIDLSNVLNGATDIVVGMRNGAGAGNQSSNYSFSTALAGHDLDLISNGLAFVEPIAISSPAGTGIVVIADAGGPFLVTIGKDGKADKPVLLNLGVHPDCPVNYADAGDINGDGLTDLVIAYGGDATCDGTDGTPSGYYTLLGKADGSFQTGKFTPFGSQLYQVKLINFTGLGGDLDLALNDQNIGTFTSGIYVLPNKADGSGTFDGTKGAEPVRNYVVSDIIAGDYNSDGKQDLTLTTVGEFNPSTGLIYANTAGVLLLPGNGNLSFGTPVLTDPGNYPLWGSYADFNGDGAPDLALVETYNIYNTQTFTPAMKVLPNLGGGTFGPPIIEMDSFTPTKNAFQGYAFTGTFTNSGGADLLISSNYGTAEFVNQGVTALALTANPATAGQGIAVTLTATASQVVGTVPAAGAVSFYSNNTLLGSSALSSGAASLTVANLPVGSDAISAVYAGDTLHNQATASASITISAVSPAFALTANAAALSMTQGATGTVTLNLAANSTFAGAITFACAGAPTEASCTIDPSSLTLGASQTGNVTVVIATTAKNNQYMATNHSWSKAAGGLSVAGLLLFVIPRRRRFSSLSSLLGIIGIAVVLLGTVATLSGCGSGGSNKYPGTPAGTSTLTVTGTSGSMTQTQTIALTVTQAQQ